VSKPEGKFTGWHFTQSENHWANAETNKDLVEKILVPYADATRIGLWGDEAEREGA
jgi:hypothetical protein